MHLNQIISAPKQGREFMLFVPMKSLKVLGLRILVSNVALPPLQIACAEFARI